MSTIQSLLNKSTSPSPSLSSAATTTATTTTANSDTATPSPSPTPAPRLLSPFIPANANNNHHPLPLPMHHSRPKPKIIKDAPVFTPGPTRGPVRFPPRVYTVTDDDDPSDEEKEDEEDEEGEEADIRIDADADADADVNGEIDANTDNDDDNNNDTNTTATDTLPTNVTTTTTTNASATSTPTSPSQAANASISPQSLAQIHAKFSLYPPQASIASYPRHIPYNSEKRVFLDKTGRDFFEVFQYTFKIPSGSSNVGAGADADGDASASVGVGHEKNGAGEGGRGGAGEKGVAAGGKTWTMLWDYNTGLVRTTPLFKCCGYGKTTPAKMLNKNVGLRDICHSITGGALVAQGYWIPYDAAKQIAATFCYSIRHALTPVFGVDFIDLCVPPSDPRFGSMLIDEKTTAQCRDEAEMYKMYEAKFPSVRPVIGAAVGSSRAGSPARGGARGRSPSPTTTVMQIAYAAPKKEVVPTALRFKAVNQDEFVGAESETSAGTRTASDVDVEVSEADDGYLISPANTLSPSSPRFRDVWAAGRAAAGGRAGGKVPRSHPRMDDDLPSPKSGGKRPGHGNGKAKRNFADFADGWMMGAAAAKGGFGYGGSAYSTPMQSPKMRKLMQMQLGLGWGLGDVDVEMEDGYEAEGEEMEVDRHNGFGGLAGVRRYHGGAACAAGAGKDFGDKDAANALLSLWDVKKKIGRRASA